MKPAIFSSLLAGGLLFGSAVGLADRTPPSPPPPPSPVAGPKPPKPPKAPKAGGSGMTIQIDGLDDMVNGQIERALDMVAHDKNIPDGVREKIMKRLGKVKAKIHAKMANGKLDPEELGDLGEEIGEEMEEFGKEMEKWGEDFGKQMEQKFGNIHVGVHDDDDDHDDDSDDDNDVSFDIDVDDDDDVADAVRDMGDLNLKPAQRDQIKKLRLDSDAKVAAAKRDLDRASEALKNALDNPSSSDADISRAIDAVSQQEALIRKARILAWHSARRVLDDAQRKKVEGAAKGKSR